MTPKQFIRYTKWLDKKGFAICDGSTMQSQSMWDILITVLTIGGVTGIFALVYYRVRDILL